MVAPKIKGFSCSLYYLYNLSDHSHGIWLVVKLHVQLELNTVSHLCNKIGFFDTLFQLKQ